MPSDPTVACIMLTRDRHELARRAVEAFRAQTYERKRLYVYDTGEVPCTDSLPDGFSDFNIIYHRGLQEDLSIGALRNRAIWWGVRPSSTSDPDCDIILHMDDDDHSHPNRIAEQVALLQSSGAEAVGYREALFWRSQRLDLETMIQHGGEAWIYSSPSPRYIVGGTMCYWRSVWERRPFEDLPKRNAAGKMGSGEDVMWQRDVKCLGVSGLFDHNPMGHIFSREPRFVGRIHGGNSMPYDVESHPDSWRRVPQFDERLREIMA